MCRIVRAECSVGCGHCNGGFAPCLKLALWVRSLGSHATAECQGSRSEAPIIKGRISGSAGSCPFRKGLQGRSFFCGVAVIKGHQFQSVIESLIASVLIGAYFSDYLCACQR